MSVDAGGDDLAQLLFAAGEGHLQIKFPTRLAAVHKAQVLGNSFVKNQPTYCGVDDFAPPFAVDFLEYPDLNGRMDAHIPLLIGQQRLVLVGKHHADAGFLPVDGQVIGSQHHVLRGHGDGHTVLRLQQIVSGKHQQPGLGLRLGGKGHMDRHLVAVKVRVEGGAHQRMQLNGPAFHQDGLKGLNAQAM